MDANLLAMLLFLTANATRETNSTKAKGGNRDVIELTKVTYEKYATRVSDEVAYGIYEWLSSQ